MSYPLPPNEKERLRALHANGLLDTPPEAAFDALVSLASYIFQAPIALVSLVDKNRLWFKASVGAVPKEVPRQSGFSTYAILSAKGLVVHDAMNDPRFNPGPAFHMNPPIRFYAGTPLITRDGYALGTICILDTHPRAVFESHQMEILKILGQHAMGQIEIRNSFTMLAQALLERSRWEAETQQKLLNQQQEMDRLSEMKDRFVTLLAHELRNPLASILNAIELLRSPQPEDALEILESQVRQLSRLTEDLLDLSRVTRGKLVLQKTPLDLTETVHKTLRATLPLFTKGGQNFITRLPEEPLWMEADPVRLEQIVSNLLTNAAKFTPAGKEVAVSLSGEGTHAVLRITDEGIGIPAEMLERIFDPFVQAQGARERGGGLGLGLPLVRQLVHLHDGTVKAESAGQGKGCAFTVSLPLCSCPLQKQAPQLFQKSAEATVQSKRVLIVDDNTEFRETLGRLLKRWGHDPLGIGSGALALEKALSFHPEVALVDLGLPDLDGFAVAECLSSQPELAGMRLIAMSGFGEEPDRAHATQAGFHAFALKPINPSHLRELVEKELPVDRSTPEDAHLDAHSSSP